MGFFHIPELPGTDMLPGIERRAVWLDRVMITFFTFQPRAIVPEHAHENEQITVVTSGAMEFAMGDEMPILRAGDGVCIPSNVKHGARILDELTEAYDAWGLHETITRAEHPIWFSSVKDLCRRKRTSGPRPDVRF